MQLVGVTAHSGVVLLDKEPADLILGNLVLLLISAGGGTGRGGGLSGLEVGSGVHGSVGGVEGIGEAMLGGIVAVDGDLSHIGHFEIEWRRYDIREGKEEGMETKIKVAVEIVEGSAERSYLSEASNEEIRICEDERSK